MKTTFFSNYLNHHQIPFSNAMRRRLGDNYYFVSNTKIGEERIKLGYKQVLQPYEIRSYESAYAMQTCRELADESDLVIIGSAPDSFIVRRLREGKLTFKYSERFYKKGTPLIKWPRHFIGAWFHHGRFQKYPIYMLCASAYTAGDAARFGNYIDRCYKWGYFPETKHYDLDALMRQKEHSKVRLLWAGRFIDWKHPEYAVLAAERLKREGYHFELDMIGTGYMEGQVQTMISDKKIGDVVHMLGSMSPEKVREYMERANIFLFTSDHQEGWGAVLNESMNSACAVVACDAIGSVPFLLKDGENGLTYSEGDFEMFYRQIKWLLDEPELRERCGRAAYRTITEMWCAEAAAERVLRLAECLQNGEDTPFADGPCSKAVIIKGK